MCKVSAQECGGRAKLISYKAQVLRQACNLSVPEVRPVKNGHHIKEAKQSDGIELMVS